MSSSEESPAQQAARLRRERREAKIKAGGSARLDKITSLSGRTPASEHQSVSPSLTPQPVPQQQQQQQQPQQQPQAQSQPVMNPPQQPSQPDSLPSPPPILTDDNTPEAMRAQQEYLRALLRANPPEQQSQQEIDQDPMMKLLSSMLGGMPGAENTAPGSGMSPPTPGDINPSDLLSSLGIPPLLSNMLFGGRSSPQTPAEKRREWILKFLHTILALFIGSYLVFLINSAVATYGGNPPPPATAQSPFVIFITAELVLSSARIFWGHSQQGTLATAMQLFKSIVRDGSIVVFAMGVGSWWNSGWEISTQQ